MERLLVTLTVDELESVVGKAVTAALANLNATQPADDYLTLSEAAKVLRCSDRQVRRLIEVGTLRASTMGDDGRKLLIARSDLQTLLRNGQR
jgi:excisionase family DNA binding protein